MKCKADTQTLIQPASSDGLSKGAIWPKGLFHPFCGMTYTFTLPAWGPMDQVWIHIQLHQFETAEPFKVACAIKLQAS